MPYTTKVIETHQMTATFTQFAAEQDARNTIQLNVTKWTLMLCDALKDAAPKGYTYEIVSGRKYHKIMMNDCWGGGSTHAFIDKKTGEVYKAASYASPAKGVRYDLRLIEQREWLGANCDWAGSYLYK
jgi:hypothetical protein